MSGRQSPHADDDLVMPTPLGDKANAAIADSIFDAPASKPRHYLRTAIEHADKVVIAISGAIEKSGPDAVTGEIGDELRELRARACEIGERIAALAAGMP
jgi:hypothetical protein